MKAKPHYTPQTTLRTGKMFDLGAISLSLGPTAVDYAPSDRVTCAASGNLGLVFLRARDEPVGVYMAMSAADLRGVAAGMVKVADMLDAGGAAPAGTVLQ
jgi:hypothetical protein